MAFAPRFNITPHLLKVIEEVATLHAHIQSATVGVRWLPLFQKDSSRRQAHGSTGIEGNSLTLAEIGVLDEGGELPLAAPRTKQEILNYLAALRFLEKKKGLERMTENGVLKLHAIIGQKKALDRGPFGTYRSFGVRVGNHIAPPAKEIPGLMNDLLAWVNGPGQAWPAVVGSAVLHYQFEYIHPFGDGNGRVGRLLATWELYRRKFDSKHIFAIDEILLENRMAYYRNLDLVQTREEDLSGWIEFIAESVAEALRRAWKRVQAYTISFKGNQIVLTPRQERLLSFLQTSGSKSIVDIQKELKLTKPGSHFVLKPLLAAGLVVREGGHKSGRYRNI